MGFLKHSLELIFRRDAQKRRRLIVWDFDCFMVWDSSNALKKTRRRLLKGGERWFLE